MEQLTMFEPTYKYIIDTSSVLSQKDNEPHRRKVYSSFEVVDEIRDEEIKSWLELQRCIVFDIDTDIQLNVKKIVSEHPKIIEFTGGKGTSSGDAFLIATAMKYTLIIITEENPDKPNKIPAICSAYGIKTVNLIELCEEENWVF